MTRGDAAHPRASASMSVVFVCGAGSSGGGLSNGKAAALTYARAGGAVAC